MVQTNNILVAFTIDNINKKTNRDIAYRIDAIMTATLSMQIHGFVTLASQAL